MTETRRRALRVRRKRKSWSLLMKRAKRQKIMTQTLFLMMQKTVITKRMIQILTMKQKIPLKMN